MIKPTDRNIIINLYKKTNKNIINWYEVVNDNKYLTWNASEKITNLKSLLYSINYNKSEPHKSFLNIYLSKKNFNIITKVKTLSYREIPAITFLFKMAIEKSGSNIIYRDVIIILNNDELGKILIINDSSSLNKLPSYLGSKYEKNNIDIDEYIKKDFNIEIKNKTLLNYKSIFYYNINNYYSLTFYMVDDYNEINLDKQNNRWVDISKLEEFYILDNDIMNNVIYLGKIPIYTLTI